jgi:hypothetical protein
MVVVALLGLVLGSAVEVSRAWRRWRFCNDRVELFADRAFACHRILKRESADLAQWEAILRRLDSLGPQPRSIASLNAASSDPVRTRELLKRFGRFVFDAEGEVSPLDNLGRMELGELGGGRRGDDLLISPVAAARHLKDVPVGPRRESIRRRESWHTDYMLMVEAYRRAALRPWEPLPREIIKP